MRNAKRIGDRTRRRRGPCSKHHCNAVDYLNDQKKAEMRNNLGQLKLLIIDEISLVGANMLYRIHLRLSDTFQTDETKVPFGGINVMLVGDLLQLPPIRQSQVFQSPEDKHCQGLEKAKPLWNELTPMILKHNHRQGKDKAYADLLNRIRTGSQTPDDLEVLNQRIRSKDHEDLTKAELFICCTRKGTL